MDTNNVPTNDTTVEKMTLMGVLEKLRTKFPKGGMQPYFHKITKMAQGIEARRETEITSLIRDATTERTS